MKYHLKLLLKAPAKMAGKRAVSGYDANTTIIASEVIIASALALGNSRHFVTSPLLSPRNDQSRNVGYFSGYFCLGVKSMNRD